MNFRVRFLCCLLVSAFVLPSYADFANPSFEQPPLGANNWQYNPDQALALWNFGARSGMANGNTAWGTGGHSGAQYAFLQSSGNPGAVSQALTGLTVGEQYRIRFWMASRRGDPGTPLQVSLDGVPISPWKSPISTLYFEFASDYFTATSTSQTVAFTAYPTGADQSSLLDDVRLEQGTQAPPGPLQNGSFERPQMPDGAWVRGVDTIDTAWSIDTQCGIANGVGSWGTGGEDGPQYAFIESRGRISQRVGFTVGQPYHVRFFMARRSGNVGGNVANPIRVLLDGTELMPFTANGSPVYQEFSSPFFIATAPSHLITFEGGATDDRTSLIDNVRVDQDAVISPNRYDLFRGLLVGGGLSDLLASDDNYLFVRPGMTFSTREAPVQVILTGAVPFNHASFLGAQVESGVSISNLVQAVDLYNYSDNRWEQVDSHQATLNDFRISFSTSDNATRFVNPATRETSMRLRVFANGPVFLYPWLYRIDFVQWAASP